MMLVASCGGGTQTDASAGAAEPDAPAQLSGDFATISGGQIDLGSLEGQDAVLWFWAPW